MASRTLLRRLNHVSQRLHMRGLTKRSNSLAFAHLARQNHLELTEPQRFCQIRNLCSKPGQEMVINIQDEKDFEDRVLNNTVPVVVDFHATWCGPCKLLGPRLESLVGGRKGKVVLAKVDVDDHDELAMKYRISSVPTVIGIRNKEMTEKFVGLQDDDKIETFLDKLIG